MEISNTTIEDLRVEHAHLDSLIREEERSEERRVGKECL